MKNILFIAVAMMSVTFACAQNITGTIKDEKGKAFTAATATLVRAKDTATVKYAPVNSDGRFQFSNIPGGEYMVKASHIGYANAYTGVITISGENVEIGEITMQKSGVEKLGEVTVVAKKPIVEVKADKTILNVEGTVNSVGQDALELLRKSPGVMVDKDDNLSLAGKNGVQVYVDGRQSPLSGKDLSDYLKTMQSSNIEAIEIITNPSAKYDAAGNAGIINIRLKKNKAFGTNGSVNAGYAIGTYPKYNAGLSLNNRNKKTNLFGNYSANINKSINSFNLYRESADTIFDQHSNMLNKMFAQNYKAGVDFFLTPVKTLGFMVNGSHNDMNMKNKGLTTIQPMLAATPYRYLAADNTTDMLRSNINLNANYRYADLKKGKDLNIDADYGYFKNNSDQFQPNMYYADAAQSILTNRMVYNMIAPTHIHLLSTKADYEQSIKKGKLGFGAKLANITTSNDFQRYNVFASAKQLDSLRSNVFEYNENINAVYASYSRPFKKFTFQAGLRTEMTSSKGQSNGWKRLTTGSYIAYDSSISRNYVDVFPSASVSFNKNPMKQFTFSYSRRIDRPAYQDLNPFEFKIDEYTSMKGNTVLKPQYTHTIGATFVYKFKLTTSATYSHVKDMFAQLVDTAEKSKSFITKKNLAKQDVVSLNVSYPFSYKKYSAFFNVNTSFSKYNADYGGNNRKIKEDVFAATIYTQQTYKINKTLTAEMSGFYVSPSIWQGFMKSKGMGGVDIGMGATVLKGKGNFRLSVSDVFRTMKWGGTSNFAGQYSHAYGSWESRQLKMNFTYRFGNSEVKAARQRKTAAEEENKRTQGGGNTIGGQ